MEEVVAGLDIGTSSIKLVLYGWEGIVFSERIEYSKRDYDGREIDPEKLFRKAIKLVRLSANCQVKIKAIGMSSLFPSLIILDKEGRPLTKIMTWKDRRGDELVQEFKKNKKKAMILQKKTGCIAHESHSVWKILWFKKHRKDIFLKAHKFLSLPDYLAYRLIGKYVVSYPIASTTGLFNINSLVWDKGILDWVGLSEDQLPSCFSLFHSEPFLEENRRKMKLGHDALLVIGAGDGHLCNIGSGCLTKKVMCSTIGTSAALRIVENNVKGADSVWKHYLYDKKYIYGMAINAGFSTLSWLFDHLFHRDLNRWLGEVDPFNLDRPAEMIVLPFFDGERGPRYYQNRVAALCGLTSKASYRDIGKAAIEGVLFNLYQCYEVLVRYYGKPKEMIATGGYVHFGSILQMQADLFNLPIKVPCFKEASAIGAAFIAWIAIGKASALSDIKIPLGEVYTPRLSQHREYKKKYKKYKKLYEILGPMQEQ